MLPALRGCSKLFCGPKLLCSWHACMARHCNGASGCMTCAIPSCFAMHLLRAPHALLPAPSLSPWRTRSSPAGGPVLPLRRHRVYQGEAARCCTGWGHAACRSGSHGACSNPPARPIEHWVGHALPWPLPIGGCRCGPACGRLHVHFAQHTQGRSGTAVAAATGNSQHWAGLPFSSSCICLCPPITLYGAPRRARAC
jgi:hypothetical protein